MMDGGHRTLVGPNAEDVVDLLFSVALQPEDEPPSWPTAIVIVAVAVACQSRMDLHDHDMGGLGGMGGTDENYVAAAQTCDRIKSASFAESSLAVCSSHLAGVDLHVQESAQGTLVTDITPE